MNSGFEKASEDGLLPSHWQSGFSGGVDAEIVRDCEVAHSGTCSVRFSNRSSFAPFVYSILNSEPIPVPPQSTWIVSFFARGEGIRGCFLSVSFEGRGENRLYMKNGSYDWTRFSLEFTAPLDTETVRLAFLSEDVTDALWIDSVSMERATIERANLTVNREPRPFPDLFPRSSEPPAKNLIIFDARNEPNDLVMAVAALQGIVNRAQPRIYLLNRAHPPGYDRFWLRIMQEENFTGEETPVRNPEELVSRFREEITGAIVYDPELPGSLHAACMLAGLENALPLSPRLLERFDLPVILDLRGKWTRNVDAYRYVFENRWDRMNHHVLAWHYSLTNSPYVQDYLVQHRIFTFWVSRHSDNLPGSDPAAEEAFVHELFASTPANIPVMGWPGYGDQQEGIGEYAGIRWCSEYGKFIPGTEFCSNLSVHSGIRIADEAHTASLSRPRPMPALEENKLYLAVNILESGDNLWYWQHYQQEVWADASRGNVPIGWGMNPTLRDTFPLILNWYYRNATPMDAFFASLSGVGYMNTQTYASRFREEDREWIWDRYVELTDRYCRALGLEGLELYNGTWVENTPPEPRTFERFVKGMKNLRYILADLGRHDRIEATNANYLIEETPVFHTLTRFRVWGVTSELWQTNREDMIAWLEKEILDNAPRERPGFMSAMAVSWYFFPSWIEELEKRLPEDVVLVRPDELAHLFLEFRQRP